MNLNSNVIEFHAAVPWRDAGRYDLLSFRYLIIKKLEQWLH